MDSRPCPASDVSGREAPLESERPSVHFIGICGTAMGAVAAAMAARGHRVTGSDARCYPPMSDFLRQQGLDPSEGFRPENVPEGVDLVVVGNAISRGNEELEHVLERRLHYVSLPEVLRRFFLRGRRNLVVSGTHGKTTTSSMLAWMFECAGLAPGFLIGGLARNLGRGARFGGSEFNVLEGDEYDTAFFDKRPKFVHYLPDTVVVNNIEFDHADIYADLEAVKTAFRHLLRLVPRNGRVVINGDDPVCLEVAAESLAPVETVGLGEGATSRIGEVEYLPRQTSFTLAGTRYTLPMDGEFNLRNAAMAATVARLHGIDPKTIQRALASFAGVGRRQESRGERRGVRLVDDFAHHPTSVREAIRCMRQRHPGCRVWALFEPRSNTTRRKVFQYELADSLAEADMVVVAAVENPGKVPEGERLDSGQLVERIRSAGREAEALDGADAIVDHVVGKAREGDVLLVLTNGGFGGIQAKLLEAL